MEVPDPTVLFSKSYPGIITPSGLGNVAWNADGQCLFTTAKSVNMLTPTFLTTLPGPPNLLDPEVTEALTSKHKTQGALPRKNNSSGSTYINHQRSVTRDINDDDGDEPMPTANGQGSTSKKVKRPKKGEMTWWMNGIEIEKIRDRSDIYEWDGVGDDFSAVVSNDDIEVRQAMWSPAGLSDMGRCLLAILNTNGQLSIFSPSSDAYSKRWEEISDLTMSTKNLLPPSEITDNQVSLTGVLEMKVNCMAWSPALPLSKMMGRDGSLLGLANRAGKIALWNYGPEGRFQRNASIQVTRRALITHMAWSEWTAVDDYSCHAQLAVVVSDGRVLILSVSQSVNSGMDELSTLTDEPSMVDGGDGRQITAISWVKGFLFWTKPGSVHIFAQEGLAGCSWSGIRSIRLDKVGNWAGANGLGSCIGMQLIQPDYILFILDTLTHHIIQSVYTNPTLAPTSPPTALALSVSSREVFMDYARSEVFSETKNYLRKEQERLITARVSGWAGVGGDGRLGIMAVEPTTFHDLDTHGDGHRNVGVIASEIGSNYLLKTDSIEDLNRLLEHPPRLLHHGPLHTLLPILIRIHLLFPKNMDIPNAFLELLCRPGPSVVDLIQDEGSSLSQSLWDNSILDGLRLRMSLAEHCARVFDVSLQADFVSASLRCSRTIQSAVLGITIQWISSQLGQAELNLSPTFLDGRFVAQILIAVERTEELRGATGMEEAVRKCKALVQDSSGQENCQICKQSLGESGVSGEMVCGKGHSWSRCSITRLIITSPLYRVCTTCPAISLIPTRHTKSPIPVSHEGEDQDYIRHTQPSGDQERSDRLVQTILEVARVCVLCGGRWMRSM